MQVKQTAEHVGFAAGAAGVVLVTSVIASTITGLQASRDYYRSEAAQPRPTVTATAPPASSAPAKPVRSHTSTPRSTPRTEPTGGRVVAASAPRSSGSGAARRPGAGAPSGPTPSPPAAQQPAAQCNIALAVAALNACLKLGGTR